MVKIFRLATLGSVTQAAIFQLHVAPHGSDEQLGSIEHPLRTPNAARDVLRRARAQGKVPGHAEVHLQTGTYPPLVLGPEDSGISADATVTYRAATGASPVFSGGTPVPAEAWAEAETPGVLVANLSSVPGTEDLGNLEANRAVHECANNKAELIFRQERMLLARFPNVQSNDMWSFLHTDVPIDDHNCFAVKDAETAKRVTMWAGEDDGWVHGYWHMDWADGYRKLESMTTLQDGTLKVCMEPCGKCDKLRKNARFYGVNLLSELDTPGEYYLDRQARRLYFYPPVPMKDWGDDVPVLTVAEAALEMSNTQHVHHEGIAVLNARGVGINAINVTGAIIRNCTVAGHGLDGVLLVGTNSTIIDSVVHDTGCAGVRAHGGDGLTLTPGNLLVTGNTLNRNGMWKRSYMPAIHWGGVANTYSHNTISFGAHCCILGGGNEVREMVPGAEVASVDNIFEYNTIDTCGFEGSDMGAFLMSGMSETGWINQGNELRHNTFSNIRNIGGAGVEWVQVQAIYFDAQMSFWEIYNNSFINCNVGTFVGGGREMKIHHNYYENCDLAHYQDNRGMGPPAKPDMSFMCGCDDNTAPFEENCLHAGVHYVLAGPNGDDWASRWPKLTTLDYECWPVRTEVRDNTYRNVSKFTNHNSTEYKSWKAILENNIDLSEAFLV